MDTYVLATVLTGMGVLLGVWRLVVVTVDGVRQEIDGVRREVHGLRRDLTDEIRAVNQRFDAVNQRFDAMNQRIDGVLLVNRNAGAG